MLCKCELKYRDLDFVFKKKDLKYLNDFHIDDML